MRLSSVCAFGIMIVLGCGVYNVANSYEKTEKKLNAVQGKIGGEEEAIRVLQAEWTFLTSPDRLEQISSEYLHLQAVDGRQYVALNTVPMRSTLDAQQQEQATPAPAPEQKIAKAEKPKKEVKIAAAKPVSDDEAFQKVLAKELAPVARALPPASKLPLPELQAMPVSAEVNR